MTTREEIPAWVPESVIQAAALLPPYATRDGVEIKSLLLTDDRMKSVWAELSKQGRKCDEARMKNNIDLFAKKEGTWHPAQWSFSAWTFDDTETANAMFFIYAVIMLSVDRPVVTKAFLKESMEPYRHAAKLCRVESTSVMTLHKQEVKNALQLVASHFERYADWIENRDDPKILERSSGERSDDRQRTLAILLAECTTVLFGAVLPGTIGKVVEIAMGLQPRTIKGKNVDGWCRCLTHRISV